MATDSRSFVVGVGMVPFTLAERRDLDYPELGASIEHPAFFAKTNRDGIRLRRRAPRIGEHNSEVYEQIGLDADALAELRAEAVL